MNSIYLLHQMILLHKFPFSLFICPPKKHTHTTTSICTPLFSSSSCFYPSSYVIKLLLFCVFCPAPIKHQWSYCSLAVLTQPPTAAKRDYMSFHVRLSIFKVAYIFFIGSPPSLLLAIRIMCVCVRAVSIHTHTQRERERSAPVLHTLAFKGRGKKEKLV